MHSLTLFAAAMAVALVGTFDHLALFVGKLVIVASLIWSGFCLLSYLLRRSAPQTKPAAVPAAVPVTPVAVTPVAVTPVPTPVPVAAPVAASAEAAIPAAIVAVIAAAVQSMLDEKHKIISIKPQDSSWEKVGRQAVLSSHRIR